MLNLRIIKLDHVISSIKKKNKKEMHFELPLAIYSQKKRIPKTFISQSTQQENTLAKSPISEFSFFSQFLLFVKKNSYNLNELRY